MQNWELLALPFLLMVTPSFALDACGGPLTTSGSSQILGLFSDTPALSLGATWLLLKLGLTT